MDEVNNTGIETTVEAPTPEPAAEPKESRREGLSRLLDEAAAATVAPEGETEVAKAQRLRDEAGRFAAGKAKPGKLSAKPTATPTAVLPPETKPWHTPPKSWAKEHHDAWTKGDADRLREIAHQREEQMRAGVEQIIPKARLADSITKAAEPYMDNVRQHAGGDIAKAVSGLMDADHKLRTLRGNDQAQYVGRLLQSYGVDVRALFGFAQQAQQMPAADPRVDRIMGEFEALKRAQTEAEDTRITSEISAFAKDKPHFEELRTEMASLVRAGVAKTLSEAYDKALRLNDTLFAQVQQTEAAKKREAADTAAKSARAAAVSVRGATPGTKTTPSKAQDRRSMLSEQLGQLEDRL